ncbi:rhodanese-like domain-containing protein [Geodermatophilus saharensis]|uniref:rhodanese-like domain-containing protein n=1 Tax=Geodermatophilus saharensis TaxID=1137994 RepID=UPI001C3C5A84|nr:rhodanese-like domain-containing protein [Geodermatophilus saharensis]
MAGRDLLGRPEAPHDRRRGLSTDPADAAAHFARRLAVGTDVSDVWKPRRTCRGGRSPSAPPRSWTGPSRWSPSAGDRAATAPTRAALALALLGFRVRETIGGLEYWAREGLPVATAAGLTRPAADPLTAPVSCGC